MPLLFSRVASGQQHLAAILHLSFRQMSVLFFQLENIPQNLVYWRSAVQHLNVLPPTPHTRFTPPLEIAISASSGRAPAAQCTFGIGPKSLCVLFQIETPQGESERVSCRLTAKLCAKRYCQSRSAVHCCGALISNCFITRSRCLFLSLANRQ